MKEDELKISALSTDVKEAFIKTICKQNKTIDLKLTPKIEKFIRHSQFFKVILNKCQAKAPDLQTYFTQQPAFYSKVSSKLLPIRNNLYSFMFNLQILTLKSNQPELPTNQPFSITNSFEDFVREAHAFIKRLVIKNLQIAIDTVANKEEIEQNMSKLVKGYKFDEKVVEQQEREWEIWINEALNLDCLGQVLLQVKEAADLILSCKKKVAKSFVRVHSCSIIDNLFEFSDRNKHSQYQRVEHVPVQEEEDSNQKGEDLDNEKDDDDEDYEDYPRRYYH